MGSRKFIAFVGVFAILIVGFVGGVNYMIDPFNIFHTNFLKYQFQMNERFMKIEYLEKEKNNFNSYMFGSSRIGTTNPKVIEKYIPNSKFYNFTISSASISDNFRHYIYMVNNGYKIENIYLQIDLDIVFSTHLPQESDFLRKAHPLVLDESIRMYYMKYLTNIFPFNTKGKIQKNLEANNDADYNLSSGVWSRPDKEKRIIENCEKYVQNEPTFDISTNFNQRDIKSNQNILALKKWIMMAKEKNQNMIIFITPHNQNLLDDLNINDYLKFLENLSQVTNFYDFSGFNSITTDNCNYYESSHYRSHVGNLIAKRIFNDQSIKVPKDFGVLVTKENIDQHLQNLKNQIKAYDLNK